MTLTCVVNGEAQADSVTWLRDSTAISGASPTKTYRLNISLHFETLSVSVSGALSFTFEQKPNYTAVKQNVCYKLSCSTALHLTTIARSRVSQYIYLSLYFDCVFVVSVSHLLIIIFVLYTKGLYRPTVSETVFVLRKPCSLEHTTDNFCRF